MNEMQVNFGHLENTSSTISTKGKTLDGRLRQLEGDLKPMMASWDGFARDAYHAAQTRWNAAAEELNRILMAVGIGVNDASNGYRDTEKINTNMW